MRLLVVHQNFPGQFGHLVKEWANRPGWDVRALGSETAPGLPGFDKLMRYRPARKGHANQHPYLRQIEAATLRGQATARAMLQSRQSGFTPDVILAHPGWTAGRRQARADAQAFRGSTGLLGYERLVLQAGRLADWHGPVGVDEIHRDGVNGETGARAAIQKTSPTRALPCDGGGVRAV